MSASKGAARSWHTSLCREYVCTLLAFLFGVCCADPAHNARRHPLEVVSRGVPQNGGELHDSLQKRILRWHHLPPCHQGAIHSWRFPYRPVQARLRLGLSVQRGQSCSDGACCGPNKKHHICSPAGSRTVPCHIFNSMDVLQVHSHRTVPHLSSCRMLWLFFPSSTLQGFMCQTGDPLGDGTGGQSIWGGEFEDEFHKR